MWAGVYLSVCDVVEGSRWHLVVWAGVCLGAEGSGCPVVWAGVYLGVYDVGVGRIVELDSSILLGVAAGGQCRSLGTAPHP